MCETRRAKRAAVVVAVIIIIIGSSNSSGGGGSIILIVYYYTNPLFLFGLRVFPFEMETATKPNQTKTIKNSNDAQTERGKLMVMVNE